jgi:hypothetical protein
MSGDSTPDQVRIALATAVVEATKAGQWDIVARLFSLGSG